MNNLDLNGPAPKAKTLEEAQQTIDALWSALGEALKRIEQLEEQLRSDSRDSSKAPSRDTPEQRAKRPKKKRTGKSQGAQPGHPKHERALVPESEVDQIERFYPEGACHCGHALAIAEEPSVRHQVFDLPEVRYQVTEYQLYSGYCPACRQHTSARLPEWVPSGQMGAGLISTIGLLAGQFHLSVRHIKSFLQEHWQLSFSTGAVSQAQGKMNA
jgi:transposase